MNALSEWGIGVSPIGDNYKKRAFEKSPEMSRDGRN